MKKLVIAFFAVVQLLSWQARADFFDLIGGRSDRQPRYDRPYRPPGGGYGRVTCQYVDEGWEEHRPHHSCQECLSLHGNCLETCYADEYSCQAVGTDSSGNTRTIEAVADEEWMAERRAYDSCYYRGLSNCHVESCDSRRHQISERSCR